MTQARDAAGRRRHDVEVAIADAGFVIVPLFDPVTLQILADGFGRLCPGPVTGCSPTTVANDPTIRVGARDLVRDTIEPFVLEVLPGYRCVVAAYVPKAAGADGAMSLHRDWSTCDERRWLPLEVWAPLHPIAVGGGRLRVVPGSHRSAEVDRGAGRPTDVGGHDDDAIELDVPLGHAVIFHPALVHGSGPNVGPDARLAIISTFQPRSADVLHYQRLDGWQTTYEVDPGFFVADHSGDATAPGRVVERVATGDQFQ